MEKTEKRVLMLDSHQHGVVINALNDMRNDLIEENRPTDIEPNHKKRTIDKIPPDVGK